MKKYLFILFCVMLPSFVMAQAVGGQITRPGKKQQATQRVGGNNTNNSSTKRIVREVTYESTLSAEEKRIWEEEKAKAKENMKILAHNLKSQGLDPTTFGGFSEGLARCKKKNGEICYIDRKGNIALSLPSIIISARDYKNGFAVVEKKGSYEGYRWIGGNVSVIDRKGNTIIPFGKYNYIFDNSEGLFFAVDQEKKCGYLNEEGKIVIPFVYEAEMGYGVGTDEESFHEGLALIKKDGKYGYIDKDGKVVIPPIYKFAHRFSEGLAAVSKDGKYRYIDKLGNITIPFSTGILDAYQFSCGLAQLIRSDNKEYFINTQGTTVIKTNLSGDEYYLSPEHKFSEDLIAICPNGAKSNKWGYMDKQGKIVIPPLYKAAGNFSEGLAFVCRNGYSGFLNKKGQVVIPFKFHNDFIVGMEFKDGIAPIRHNDKWGYVDKYGNSTFDFE